MQRAISICLFVLLAASGSEKLSAVTLDWDAVAWTAGSLSNSYDIDPSKPGNDITFSIGGDTANLIPDSAAPMAATPSLVTSLHGGLAVAQQTLLLHLNLANQAQVISVSVNFSANYTLGVQNVSFTIFDVDFGASSFQDQLRSISALSIDGITLIAPTITTSVANSVSGSGLSQVVNGNAGSNNTGAGSGNGNVTISFGSNAIRSFSFLYGSGSTAPADPGTQKIGIHDLSFTPVPEINPAWTAILSCISAAGVVFRHRAKFRK